MLVKFIKDEDFVNYKKPSMFIGFPTCTFKCEKESGCSGMCQNSSLVNMDSIDIDYESIVKRYINNSLSKSIVFGGLEPFDSFPNLCHLVKEFRKFTEDDIVWTAGQTDILMDAFADDQYDTVYYAYAVYELAVYRISYYTANSFAKRCFMRHFRLQNPKFSGIILHYGINIREEADHG